MTHQNQTQPPQRPLYGLNAAAACAGLSPEVLTSAIAHGDLPGVRVLSLGPRKLRFIRSKPFLAWLDGREPPDDAGPDADDAAERAVAGAFDPAEYNSNLFE